MFYLKTAGIDERTALSAFLKENGILDELEKLGIKDGDTVRIYGFSFEYYK